MDYEKDVAIDPDALDIEWMQQAELMLKYTRYAAERKREVDDAKEALDFFKAVIERDIRANPENFGLSKITEAVVQSTILLQPEYQKVSKTFIDTRYEYEIAIGAVRSIDQKKSALENLVKLLGVSYFAGPVSPRNLQNEYIKQVKQRSVDTKVQIGQNPTMKRKKRKEKN